MINVLILCGGQSPEHEISLRSARNVVDALDKEKFQPVIVGIDQKGIWHLLDEVPESSNISCDSSISINPGVKSISYGQTNIQIDVAFPVLHGPNGEDGAVQGMLQMLDIPYVGPDILGSSVAMDKDVAKTLLASAGLRVANGTTLFKNSESTFEQVSTKYGLPLFIKPANMGSSVGVHRVTNSLEYDAAIRDAFRFDHKVLVEEAIDGREIECAVLGFENLTVTNPGEIRSPEEYSFKEKYSESSETQLDIPARDIDSDTVNQLKETALKAFKALQCSIMSRVDMFLTRTGEIYVNEINTIPGFTSISMYPKLWEHEGISYRELISKLLELAIERHDSKSDLMRSRL